jgi:hypothetical protein
MPLSLLAECACAQAEWARCLELSEKAIEVRLTARTQVLHPTFVPKHIAAAVALRGLGRAADSEARFDVAERVAAPAGEAWRARVLTARGGVERTAEAVRLLTAALGAGHPDTLRARAAQAAALLDAGKAVEAEAIYAALGDGVLPAVKVDRARALIALGRGGEARVLLATVAADAEDHRSASEAARLLAAP